MSLTKKEIIQQINQPGYNMKESAEIVETLLEIMKQSLENGEDIKNTGCQ